MIDFFTISGKEFAISNIVQQLLTLADNVVFFFLVDCIHISLSQTGWFTLLTGNRVKTKELCSTLTPWF